MKKFVVSCCALLCAASLFSCSSNNDYEEAIDLTLQDSLKINGKVIYLLGEMNNYTPSAANALQKSSDNRYCVVSALRSDWAPYRFKFADDSWSEGSRFGFKNPPGAIYDGSAPVLLNANSRFEELKFYPSVDGMYNFCLIKSNNHYYATVTMEKSNSLAYLTNLMHASNNHIRAQAQDE